MSLWRVVRRWRFLAGLGVSPISQHSVCARMICRTGGPALPVGTRGGVVFFHARCDDLNNRPFWVGAMSGHGV